MKKVFLFVFVVMIGLRVGAQVGDSAKEIKKEKVRVIDTTSYYYKESVRFRNLRSTRHKLTEIYGGVTFETSFEITPETEIEIEVKESGTITIEKYTIKGSRYFQLNNLEYDKWYVVYFSAPNYYTRFIRIYTQDVPDSLKQKKFITKPIYIPLKSVINKEVKNPFDKDYSVLIYQPIELLKRKDSGSDKYITIGADRDSLVIVAGGIVAQSYYTKSNAEWEVQQETKLYEESDKKNKKKIEGYEMKVKLQQLQQEKIAQELELKNSRLGLLDKENEVKKLALDKNLLQTQAQAKSIEMLSKDKQLQQNEIVQQTRTRNFFIAGLVLMMVFAAFIFRSLRVRNKQNKIITQQKQVVEKQKHLVEEKNREITDSITYALRIQNAILPTQKIVKQYLENSFILYKPKDIVAGDFYWMETIGFENLKMSQFENGEQEGMEFSNFQINKSSNYILFAACDCTGHGVPGAMVSVVCHNALNRAVREFGLTKPSEILDKTTEIVAENFAKSEENIRDGMDISLASIKYNVQNTKMELQWSGANNPLWLVRAGAPLSLIQGEGQGVRLEEIKANKQPIGISENKQPFTNHTLELNSGDTIYLFTDGYADQFGGESGEKKLTKKKFKELLLSLQPLSMEQQGAELNKFIEAYRKEVEQIDDILVMGVRA